jgi:predicted GNAT family acetyltransferase
MSANGDTGAGSGEATGSDANTAGETAPPSDDNRTGELTVADAPEQNRYEARIGGDLAGFAAYLRAPEVIAFVHTEVNDAYEGRGVGSSLARTALDEARAQGLRVVAICPFIAGWIDRHPAYRDLLDEPTSDVSG